MKKLILTFLILISIVSFGAKEGLEKGDLFSKINLYNTSGDVVGTSDDYMGKITIYNFGASWCPPCKFEKPLLNEFYLENLNEVNVVSMMIDTDPKAVDKFFKDTPMDFPHYFDKGQKLANKFLIRVVPTTYIVDTDGVILARIHGAADWSALTTDDLKALRD